MEQPQKERKLKKLPVVLSEEEIKKLFSVIDNPKDSMLLQMIYYFGCRVGEAIKIKKSDINLKEKIVILRAETTKRSKERQVPIPENFVMPLKYYLSGLMGEDIVLFQITKQRVWQIVKKYGQKAGITKKIHPHTLRHSYATRIYTKTKDTRLIQELLGHESATTTAIYTHLDNQVKQDGIKGVF